MADLGTNESYEAGGPERSKRDIPVIEGLLWLVMLALVGFIVGYVIHVKRSADASLDQASKNVPTVFIKQTGRQPGAAAAPKLPDGWTAYRNSGYHFGFATPDEFAPITAYTSAAPDTEHAIAATLQSAAPATPSITGISETKRFMVTIYKSAGATIPARKYGPEVKLQAGRWIVVSDNPGDPKPYKAGATYTEAKTARQNGLTTYSFTSGDEGVVEYSVAFVSDNHLVVVQLPPFDTGSYSSAAVLSQAPYDALLKQFVATIYLVK
jgi:hypothetical protein